MVTTPEPDATFWSAIAAGVAVIGGFIGWFLREIRIVRNEAAQATADGDARLSVGLEKLRAELTISLDGHRREFADAQREAAKFREYIVSTMATRNDLERAIDKQTEQLIDRLDARFAPMRR